MASQHERRAAPRLDTDLPVIIVHGDGVARQNGDLQNLSPLGARIAVEAAQALPEKFYLLMPEHRMEVCKVVWRKNQEMGVAFQL
jgi:hypothetical protein